MNRIKKIGHQIFAATKHHGFGVLKEVLVVGSKNPLIDSFQDKMKDSFNFHQAYSGVPSDPKSPTVSFDAPIEEPQTLQAFQKLTVGRGLLFDAIFISDNTDPVPGPQLSDEALVSPGALNQATFKVQKALFAYQVARTGLQSYGTIINFVKNSHFDGSSTDPLQYLVDNQTMHLTMVLSDLKYLDYNNRLYTILYDDQSDPRYLQATSRLVENMVWNKKAPAHNTFLHAKWDADLQRTVILHK